MSQYILMQSKSPWSSRAVADFYELASRFANAGHDVTLFLVQNGVLAARREAQDPDLRELRGRVKIVADDFSLRERAIDKFDLAAGVSPAPIEEVVRLLAAGAKALWN
jgi:hypothetical protein